MNHALRAGWICSVLILAACQQSVMVRPAPSADRSERPVRDAGSTATDAGPSYTVQPGDTLYKISVQYGVDYRDLARWNDISPPYTIYPRQTLRVGTGSGPAIAASAPASSSSVSSSVQKPPAGADRVGAAAVANGAQASPAYDANLGVTLPEGAEPISGAPSQPSTPVFEPTVQPAATTAAASSAAQTASSTVAAATTPAPATTSSVSVAAARPSAAGWIWPTSGKVVVTYSSGDPTRQGIDIVGELGQPVIAARDGEVVYSGAGLIGYGELVIVKHSPELLSAYGHNRTRLVKEGDKVKAGQKIAEMGKSSSNRVLLHFEVRKNGKPVDPMPLLPAR